MGNIIKDKNILVNELKMEVQTMPDGSIILHCIGNLDGYPTGEVLLQVFNQTPKLIDPIKSIRITDHFGRTLKFKSVMFNVIRGEILIKTDAK